MTRVIITDYVSNPSFERDILGDDLSNYDECDKDKVEVLLVWHQHIDEDYLKQFKSLKAVVRYGVGFDSVDKEAIKSRNLVFCNGPDYGTDEVSDTAIAMALSLVRGIHEYDNACRSYVDGSWQENTVKSITRTSSLKFGVVGAGRIGTAVLRKASALGFNCAFFDPYVVSGYEKAINIKRYETLKQCLAECDVISIHTPLCEETRGMVNESFIGSMKDGSYFVNTARGEIIKDVDIFLSHLNSGHLAGIALDVLPEEPPKDSVLIDQWRKRIGISKKVIINPHTAYYSSQAYSEMRCKAALNAKNILLAAQPKNIIWDFRIK